MRRNIPDVAVHIEDDAAHLRAFGGYECPHNGGYQQPVLHVRNGKALLILRKTGHGDVTVLFSAEGMHSAEIRITV